MFVLVLTRAGTVLVNAWPDPTLSTQHPYKSLCTRRLADVLIALFAACHNPTTEVLRIASVSIVASLAQSCIVAVCVDATTAGSAQYGGHLGDKWLRAGTRILAQHFQASLSGPLLAAKQEDSVVRNMDNYDAREAMSSGQDDGLGPTFPATPTAFEGAERSALKLLGPSKQRPSSEFVEATRKMLSRERAVCVYVVVGTDPVLFQMSDACTAPELAVRSLLAPPRGLLWTALQQSLVAADSPSAAGVAGAAAAGGGAVVLQEYVDNMSRVLRCLRLRVGGAWLMLVCEAAAGAVGDFRFPAAPQAPVTLVSGRLSTTYGIAVMDSAGDLEKTAQLLAPYTAAFNVNAAPDEGTAPNPLQGRPTMQV